MEEDHRSYRSSINSSSLILPRMACSSSLSSSSMVSMVLQPQGTPKRDRVVTPAPSSSNIGSHTTLSRGMIAVVDSDGTVKGMVLEGDCCYDNDDTDETIALWQQQPEHHDGQPRSQQQQQCQDRNNNHHVGRKLRGMIPEDTYEAHRQLRRIVYSQYHQYRPQQQQQQQYGKRDRNRTMDDDYDTIPSLTSTTATITSRVYRLLAEVHGLLYDYQRRFYRRSLHEEAVQLLAQAVAYATMQDADNENAENDGVVVACVTPVQQLAMLSDAFTLCTKSLRDQHRQPQSQLQSQQQHDNAEYSMNGSTTAALLYTARLRRQTELLAITILGSRAELYYTMENYQHALDDCDAAMKHRHNHRRNKEEQQRGIKKQGRYGISSPSSSSSFSSSSSRNPPQVRSRQRRPRKKRRTSLLTTRTVSSSCHIQQQECHHRHDNDRYPQQDDAVFSHNHINNHNHNQHDTVWLDLLKARSFAGLGQYAKAAAVLLWNDTDCVDDATVQSQTKKKNANRMYNLLNLLSDRGTSTSTKASSSSTFATSTTPASTTPVNQQHDRIITNMIDRSRVPTNHNLWPHLIQAVQHHLGPSHPSYTTVRASNCSSTSSGTSTTERTANASINTTRYSSGRRSSISSSGRSSSSSDCITNAIYQIIRHGPVFFHHFEAGEEENILE